MTLQVPDALIEGEKLELPSGKVATVFPCKGKHIRMASTMTNGDQALFMPALMAQLVKINGSEMVMEQFDELDGKDYMAIMTKVSAGLGDFT